MPSARPRFSTGRGVVVVVAAGARRQLGLSQPQKAAARSQQLRNAVFAVRASRATRPREGAGAAWRFRSGEQRTRQVISLRRWLETAGIGDGRVSAGSIATGTSGARYRNRALVAEIAAAAVRGGLRAIRCARGFITAAARAGRSEAAIMRHWCCKSVQIASLHPPGRQPRRRPRTVIVSSAS